MKFQKIWQRENFENKNPQLLMPHIRTEAIKMTDFMMKLNKRKEIQIFQIL